MTRGENYGKQSGSVIQPIDGFMLEMKFSTGEKCVFDARLLIYQRPSEVRWGLAVLRGNYFLLLEKIDYLSGRISQRSLHNTGTATLNHKVICNDTDNLC
ncbi:MAG: hypothetical protein ACYC6Q_10425 [Syntrophales bacterium]